MKGFLSENFEIRDMGEDSYVIDIKVYRDRQSGLLLLSQNGYISKVL